MAEKKLIIKWRHSYPGTQEEPLVDEVAVDDVGDLYWRTLDQDEAPDNIPQWKKSDLESMELILKFSPSENLSRVLNEELIERFGLVDKYGK